MAAVDTLRIGDTPLPMIGSLPVAAATQIDQGTMVFRDANGRATIYSADPLLIAVGIALVKADNSAGAAGDIRVQIRYGVFLMAVAGADPVTDATVKPGAPVFAHDASTIRKGSAAGTKPMGGQFLMMDPDGSGKALVLYSPMTLAAVQGAVNDQALKVLVTIPVMLVRSANAAVLARFKAPMTGKITDVALQVTDPATTGAKAGAVDVLIAGVGMTGGQIAATSANMTPLGNRVAGAAITALNLCAVGDVITAVWSGVTAFVEGEAVLQVEFTASAAGL